MVSKTEILEVMLARGRLTAKEIHENPFLRHHIGLNALTQALLRMSRQQLVNARALPQRIKGPGKKPKGFRITPKGLDYLSIKEDKKQIFKKPTINQTLGFKLDSLTNFVTSFIAEHRQRWAHEDLVKSIENSQEIAEMQEQMIKNRWELRVAVYKARLALVEAQRNRMASEKFYKELIELYKEVFTKVVANHQKQLEEGLATIHVDELPGS